MKTTKKKSTEKSESKTKGESAGMARMRKKFKQQQQRSKRGGGGGGEDSIFLELKAGNNLVRPLPWPDHEEFFSEAKVHFRVGPDEKTVRCADPVHFDEKTERPTEANTCFLERRFLKKQALINKEYKKGDEEGRAEWGKAKQKYVAKSMHYMNVLILDDDGNAQVKVLRAGPQIMEQLLGYMFGEDADTVGDFTDIETGQWMRIKRSGKGPGQRDRRTEYEVRSTGDILDISDDWDEIKAMLHDLDSDTVLGPQMTNDEIKAIYEGTAEEETSDDGDEEAEEDESDPGDEEEEVADDDDDDAPPPPKKSGLGKKLGKKVRK